MEILCFFAGIVFFYTKSLYALLFIIIALFLKANRSIIYWFLLALLWAGIHTWLVADQGMPNSQVIQHATLLGTVDSIPVRNKTKTQFQFTIRELNAHPVKASILLACYDHCPLFKSGQHWRLQAKLKKPVNLGNPGSLNYQRDLNARHIDWTGYIKKGNNTLIADSSEAVNLLVLREHLAEKLEPILPKKDALGIAQALTLGITTHLDTSLWDLFRRTGTTHLMVISGSHIVLIAGLIYWLMSCLWSCSSRLCLKFPAMQVASIASFIVAVIYTLLAGFGVPAQRSLIACFFVLLPHFLSQRFTVWQAWRYALLAVIIYEPHTVLQSGFYLSFIAVAILISVSRRIPYKGIRQVIGLQLACLFGLMPFTLFWFSYGAINGLLANLVAIPIVGYVLVPLSLLALIVAQFSTSLWLAIPLNLAIEVLLTFLQWVDNFSGINLILSLTNILSMFALMLVIFILFFIPLRSLFPAIFILFISVCYPGYPRVKENEAQIDVVDVGQGLAMVIRTANHTLIYDAGVKFYQGGDMAQMAIIPYLTTLGIHKIDKIVISHPDLDHRGGLESLEEKYPSTELVVDNVKFYHRGENCHQYPEWNWDGVAFRFLAIKQAFRDKNNSSCVLQISANDKTILLTGDIEKLAEHYLVNTYQNQLAANTLIVAHHGSKTSSSPDFIKAISPQFAIISSGFDNRYHFPHQQTLTTLADFNIKIFNTATCGMVTYVLNSNKLALPSCYYT